MLASLVKLLPFIQMLVELFKPGDGEHISRRAKITALAFVLLLIYSGFVSYVYIQQYHKLVEIRSHDNYTSQGLEEKKEALRAIGGEAAGLRAKLYECYRSKPYEQDDKKQPPTVIVPPVPVNVDSKPEKKIGITKKPVGVNDGSEFRQQLLNRINGKNS